MKKILSIFILICTIMTMFTSVAFADNPVVQTNYTADPAPMVYNGVMYLYTTHDEDQTVNNFFTMNDWRCYSTTDMVNWVDHGSPLAYTDFSWAKGDAWAAQCVPRNGKYYLYVPMTQKTGATAVGVAVSDSPYGPFTDPINKPLVSTGSGDIDPTVYIDSDGQAYLYWGNPRLYYVKLNQDMISYSGSINEITLTVESFGARSKTDRETSYEEGPWFYKRGNLYYMVFAGGPISEHIGYSTSTSPTGPWTYGGIIMPTQGGSFTNHPGVADYKGNSYLFYHNGALPGGGGYKRSVGVEKFNYNADGTIPTINMTTTGALQIEYLNPYVKTEAETIAWESGIETEENSNGGVDVYSIDNGDYIKVKGVDFGTTGAGIYTANIACASNGGTIELHLDSTSGTIIGSLPVSYTGGENVWKDKTTNISGATGVHDLYMVFKGDSTGNLFKFDNWQFTQKSTSKDFVAINASLDKKKIDTVSGSNTANLSVKAVYSDGTSADVTTSAAIVPAQSGIIDINNGVITGKAYGSTSINVSFGGKTDTLYIDVKDLFAEQAVKELAIDNSVISLNVNGTISYKITATYFDGHNEDVTNKATIDNPHPEIATISNGIVTAKANGSTLINVSYRGLMGDTIKSQISVTVTTGSPYVRYEVEAYDEQSGIQTENCSEGTKNIGFIENGDWVKYKNIDFGSGAMSFDARVSSSGGGGKIEVRLDSLTGTLVGTCTVNPTGSWTNWTTNSCDITGATGVHDVYLKFTGGSSYLFNVNWWQFKPIVQNVKPFSIITNGILDRTGGIKANIKIAPVQGTTNNGQEVVVFQLMKDTTPVSIIALIKDITAEEEFTAFFNVKPSDTTYKVNTYVLDSFTTDLTKAPISLADSQTLK